MRGDYQFSSSAYSLLFGNAKFFTNQIVESTIGVKMKYLCSYGERECFTLVNQEDKPKVNNFLAEL